MRLSGEMRLNAPFHRGFSQGILDKREKYCLLWFCKNKYKFWIFGYQKVENASFKAFRALKLAYWDEKSALAGWREGAVGGGM